MSEEPKITYLHGDRRPAPPSHPNDSIIRFLEQLLQEARAGTIQALAVVDVDREGSCGYHIVGQLGSFDMIGAAQCVVHELARITTSEDVDA